MSSEGSFEELLKHDDLKIKEIARGLRKLIFEVYPPVVEVVWEKQGISGYGSGVKKMSEQFCYIALLKNHVNLGFYYGVDLNDPTGLLEGTGKKLRHIKIRSPAELKNPELRHLIQRASKYLPKLK